MKKFLKQSSAVILILLFLTSGLISNATDVYAQTKANKAAKIDTLTMEGPTDAIELEKFCDHYFQEIMKKEKIPGAVISVVKDGNVLLEKGYGYANAERKEPATPQTPFYICSTGKLFTGTAIMQLYEQGKIKNLNDDVTSYLDTFKVRNKYSNPVTFSNLLTHTSGLDSGSMIGGGAKSFDQVLSYPDYLRMKLKKVISKPGLYTRYSNLGYDLLGYLIQEISGTSYPDYIKKNILQPLNMTCSTVGKPPVNLATSYLSDGKAVIPQKSYVYYTGLGEGCIYSTADDMTKFMNAHLYNGDLKGNRILQESTAKLMHLKQTNKNLAVPGMCYTFLESYTNNQRAIRHEGGDASGFTTTLYLLPKYHLGFFIAINTLSTMPFEFEYEFMNHYFPDQTDAGKPNIAENDNSLSKELVGTYRSYDDVSMSTIGKVVALFDTGDITITAGERGTLKMKGTSLKPFHADLIPIGDLQYRYKNESNYIAFQRGENQKVLYLFNEEPQKTFHKIHWYETKSFSILLFITCILIFVINMLCRSIKLIRNRIRKDKQRQGKLEIVSDTAICITSSFFIISTAIFLGFLMKVDYTIQYGMPIVGYIALSGLLLGAVFTMVTSVICIISWLKKRFTFLYLTLYTFSCIACIAYVWFLNCWNLLGYKLN